MEAENEFKKCEIILGDHRGIYIPRDFAEAIDPDCIKDLDKFKEDLEICKDPDHEHYWEAWQNILDNMEIDLMRNGEYWKLYQDGDLFAVIYKD